MAQLSNKVAVVTGASKGIGAGIALRLAEAGASVVVNYSTSKDGADKVVAAITSKGGKAIAVQAKISELAEVQRLFAEAVKAFGRVDTLVNNAGVYGFMPLDAITEEEFHRQFNTNVLGLLLATQEAVRHMPAEGGSVINIGSVISTRPMATSTVYAATKAAVDIVTRTLSQELGPRKIRVNSVNPGMVETEGAVSAGIIGSDFEAMAVAQTPLGRIGQPKDIADVVVFLASEEAGWLNGELITATGGYR